MTPLDVLVALVVLLPMGLLGVALLRRLPIGLVPLEWVAYGVPLGWMIASMVLYGIALVERQLKTIDVLLLAGICVATAYLLSNDSLEAFRAWLNGARSRKNGDVEASDMPVDVLGTEDLQQKSLDLSVVHVADVSASGVPVLDVTKMLPGRFSEMLRRPARVVTRWPVWHHVNWVAVVLFTLLACVWYLFWSRLIVYNPDGLDVRLVWFWNDGALHISDVNAMVYGGNFPVQDLRYSHTIYGYHLLTSITTAALVKVGLSTYAAISVHSWLGWLFILLSLYAFSRRLLRRAAPAVLATLFYVFGGNLSWILTVRDFDASGNIKDTLLHTAYSWGGDRDSIFGYSNFNFFILLFQAQRSFIYGIPLFLMILSILIIGLRRHHWAPFAVAGCLVGLAPLAALPVLLGLALVLPFLALLAPTGRNWRRPWTCYPIIRWVLFAIMGAVTALPTYVAQYGALGGGSRLVLDPEWIVQGKNEPLWWYWIKALGAFIPLFAAGLLMWRKVPRRVRLFGWASLPLFIIVTVWVFQPWPPDNHKLFAFGFIGLAIVAAAAVTELWRESRSWTLRFFVGVIALSVMLTGLLSTWSAVTSSQMYSEAGAADIRMGLWVRDNTPPQAVFAAAQEHNSPVSMIGGRPLMVGFGGWLSTRGFDYGDRESVLHDILTFAPDTVANLSRYAVDYVVIGQVERKDYNADLADYLIRFPVAYHADDYYVFAVSRRAIDRAVAHGAVVPAGASPSGSPSQSPQAGNDASRGKLMATIHVLISLVFLAALGVSGSVALSWARLGLTRLELVAYGFPAGMVVWSLVVLIVASVLGQMSLALIIGVGVASVAVAAALTPSLVSEADRSAIMERLGRVRERFPSQRLSFVEQSPVFGPALPTTSGADRRGEWLSRIRQVLAWRWFWPVVICGGFIVRWAFLWGGMFQVRDDGLHTGQINVWGDWPQHVGDAASFVYGDNFPPQHPRMAGVPYAYHYLSSLTGSMLIRFGMAPYTALALHSFVLSVLIALGLLAFALRLVRDTRTAALAVLLFLLGGGFGWLLIVQQANNGNVLSTIWNHPWDSGQQRSNHFWWENFYFSSIEPQRSVLYGLPLSLLILTLLFIGIKRWQWRSFAAAGIVVGLLPFAHLGALPALAMIAPMVALLFPSGDLRGPIGQWYPVRRWLVFGIIAVALAGPQLLLQSAGQPATVSGFGFHFGWLKGDSEPVWWFWLKNLGWFVPLIVIGLLRPRLFGGTTYRFLLAFMPIFVIDNLVKLQADPLDNIKTLLYWNLAICVLSAVVLVHAWRQNHDAAVRTVMVSVVAMMLLSGVLINLQQARGLDQPLWMSQEEMHVADLVRNETAPDAVFAIAPRPDHPISTLSGRPVVMGFWWWLTTRGYDTKPREQALKDIYALAPDTQQMVDMYNIDYVVIGPREEDEYNPDLQQWVRRYPVAIQTDHYLVFAVSPAAQNRLEQRQAARQRHRVGGPVVTVPTGRSSPAPTDG